MGLGLANAWVGFELEKGFGTLLMEEAERIAVEEHGSTRIAVISGVGTRHYYRKLGYGKASICVNSCCFVLMCLHRTRGPLYGQGLGEHGAE